MRSFGVLIFLLLPAALLLAQVSLDVNYGIPFQLDDLNAVSFDGDLGSSWTGNLQYVKKNFGFGVQYSHNRYTPNQMLTSSLDLVPGLVESGASGVWKTNLLSIGPVLRLGKGRFHLGLFPKLGFAGITPSSRVIELPQGNENILVYQDNSETLAEDRLFYGMDGSLQVDLSSSIGLQLLVGYNTNAGLGEGCSTIFREALDAGAPPSAGAIQNSRLLRKDCSSYGLLTTGIGIKISFGPRRPKEEVIAMLPPVPFYPEDGASLAEADAKGLRLEWQPEQPEVRQANYRVFLYQVTAGGADSLIYEDKTNQQLRLQLPSAAGLSKGAIYRWKVQAVEDQRLAPCPDGCYSMLFTFEVGGPGIPAFYQLLDKNAGAAVPSGGILRFIIDPDLLYKDRLLLSLRDERNSPVLENIDIRRDSRVTALSSNRFELPIGQLAAGQEYTLEVSSGKRTQYLRFYKPGKSRTNDNP